MTSYPVVNGGSHQRSELGVSRNSKKKIPMNNGGAGHGARNGVSQPSSSTRISDELMVFGCFSKDV